jgi:hypothetical protein
MGIIAATYLITDDIVGQSEFLKIGVGGQCFKQRYTALVSKFVPAQVQHTQATWDHGLEKVGRASVPHALIVEVQRGEPAATHQLPCKAFCPNTADVWMHHLLLG